MDIFKLSSPFRIENVSGFEIALQKWAIFLQYCSHEFLRKRSDLTVFWTIIPASFCLFKVKNRNTRKTCEICPILSIKIPEK